MKVVLFCGGLGTRLRAFSDTIPKPLVSIGDRPILWYLMRYYAHFGHDDFVLCLGNHAEHIREFFLDYNAAMYADVRVSADGGGIEFLDDVTQWTVTLADTGIDTNVGQRLAAVRGFVAGEEVFLANYADGLSDLDLAGYVDQFCNSHAIASFICVKPPHSFSPVRVDSTGTVTEISSFRDSDIWVNGGFFVFRQEIFDYIGEGEELVEEPFDRLIGEGKLRAHLHHGFWAPMDTLKDKIAFDEMLAEGRAPWKVWER